MSEDIQRLRKRIQVETAVINLSMLAALLFSARILYHAIVQVLTGLAQLIP